MKRLALGAVIAVTCFVGVFGALRADRYLQERATLRAIENPAMGIATDLPADGGAIDFRAAVKKVMPAVVSVDRRQRIQRFFSDEVELQQTATGSGVIISREGYVLTNNHVVEGADSVGVRLSDKRSVDAKVIGTDPRSDLAVLKIELPNLTFAELADSDKLEVGQWVIAIGNPLGFANTVSVGVVSSLNRTLPTSESLLINAIQTDAAINQGNSGGALTNASGQVVGINSAIASPSGGSVGIGFAIPINRARRVVDDILKFGRVRYGWLGAAIYRGGNQISDPRTRSFMQEQTGSQPPKVGLIVTNVDQASPAAKAGIKQFDMILEIDGQEMDEPIDYFKAMNDKRPGDAVKLKVWEQGQVKTLNVTLQDLTV